MQRPSTAFIGPDLIDIWTWSLDVSQPTLGASVMLLSADECARATRFVRERDKRRFVAARAQLRSILGRYLEVSPQSICFKYSDYGKPHLTIDGRPPLYFNLSHSADLAVLALSDCYEIGIDLEEIRFLKEDIAKRFFSHREYQALRALPPSAYLDGFYSCWTRKEAFVKAHGHGLSLPLNNFDVTFDGVSEPKLEWLKGDPDAPSNWSILALKTPTNFAGAVVASTRGHSVHLRYQDVHM